MLNRRDLMTGVASLAALPLQTLPGVAQSATATQSATILTARPTTLPLSGPDKPPTECLTFGGSFPGPVLRARQGEPLRLSLRNEIGEPVSLHVLGLRGASSTDGVAGLSGPPLAPGASQDLVLTPPDAGLFIYRPMVAGRTAELAERGLQGLLVVDATNEPASDLDLVVAVDDVLLAEDGSFAPFPAASDPAGQGRLGNRLLVNGTPAPLERPIAPGARVRLRLANLCNARALRIRFDDLKAWVIAIDGQPTDTFEPLRSTLPLLPGSRYELMIEAPAASGTSGAMTALLGNGVPLLRLKADSAAGEARKDLGEVKPLPPNDRLPAVIRLERSRRADLVIDGGARPAPDGKLVFSGDPTRAWSVNGAFGDGRGGKPLLSVRKGTPVVIGIANRTAWLQTICVHGHCVRLLHPLDDGWEPYWLNTVPVPAGQTLRIAFIADNPGKWLIGSTQLERLDGGLASWFEVTG
jgi:FtsP/CotA-like multicopper oxidase with cupredoxin domain